MLSRDVAACSDFIASLHTPSSHEGEADNNKGLSAGAPFFTLLVFHSLGIVGVGNEIIVKGGVVREWRLSSSLEISF